MSFVAVGAAVGGGVAAGVAVTASTAAALAGIGMSAAGAAGAFGQSPEKWRPTQQEQEATAWANKVRNLGNKLQQPIDAGARRDLAYLRSPTAFNTAAADSTNQSAKTFYPGMNQALAQSLVAGGPSSGQFWNTLGRAGSGMRTGAMASGVAGRSGALNDYLTAGSQFLGRRTGDLQSGMESMASGGLQAAQAQSNRIQAQTQNKIAMNQAMGQLGGSMIGAGMSGLSAAGGLGGLTGVASSPSAAPGYISPGRYGAIY